MPKKARRFKPLTITVVKTVPKALKRLNENNFKIKRRTFNRALQKVAANYQWRTINIDAILPSTEANFDEIGDNLSKVGTQLLWDFISEDVRAMEYPTANSKNVQ